MSRPPTMSSRRRHGRHHALRLCFVLQRFRLSVFRDSRLFRPICRRHEPPVGRRTHTAFRNGWARKSSTRRCARRAFRAVCMRMPWIQIARDLSRRSSGHGAPRRDAVRDLWSYLDVRDAGQGFLLALEWQGDGHLRVLLSAADTFMERRLKSLVAPGLSGRRFAATDRPAARDLSTAACQSDSASSRAHSWRDYPEARESRQIMNAVQGQSRPGHGRRRRDRLGRSRGASPERAPCWPSSIAT